MKRIAVFVLSALFAATLAAPLAGCAAKDGGAWSPGKRISADKLVLGVIFLDKAESGWSYAHNTGIKEAQKAFGLRDDQIIRKYDVGDADAALIEYTISEAIAEGANVILASSWGFMDVCEKMAAENPNVLFAHASGYKYNDTNFTNYFGRLYQARYLAGIVAGMCTSTNKVGFVAAQDHTNSEVTGGLDAFALGVESVNPEATIYVRVTHSWFDPAGERRAAERLISEGCDVIAQHCDNAEPQIAAQEAGVLGIGNNMDMSGFAPGTVLTSVIWHWETYYKYLIGSLIDGTFTTAPYVGDVATGMVDIAPLNPAHATAQLRQMVDDARRRIVADGFNVFEGVMETNDGRSIGSPGGVLPDEEIFSGIDWYYHNIVVID